MNTILIVDDEFNVCDNIAEILRNNSYKVITASNGIEAMQRLDATIPDLIISDVIMPQMDGYQLLEFVENSKRLSHIPFIFLTARSSNDNIREGMLNGADDYLTKPFRATDLLKAVEVRLKKKENYKEQMARLRENIAFSIQHELRTPLTPIIGYSDLLIECSHNLSVQEIEGIGESIKLSALKLKSSVEKFILFSNIQYELNEFIRKKEVYFTENLNVLVKISGAKLNELNEKRREIRYQVNECRLKIKEEYFITCVYEILENAFKFSKNDSIINVTGNLVNEYFELSIENNDSWMTPEQIESIDILSRQKDPATRGSGLGLPIVKKITEFFGGGLEITSEKDKCVKVSIRLPIMNDSVLLN